MYNDRLHSKLYLPLPVNRILIIFDGVLQYSFLKVSESFLTVFVNPKVYGKVAILHSSTDKKVN